MLTDGVINLREISANDIRLLYDWRNDPQSRPMFRDDRALDFDAHCGFLRRYFTGERGEYWWIAEVSGVPVGTICLYSFDTDRHTCEFGRFIIGREHRGAGYGRRALLLAMSVARSLGVERMVCEVLSSNESAIRLYDSLGFVEVGIDPAGPRRFILMEAELNQK